MPKPRSSGRALRALVLAVGCLLPSLGSRAAAPLDAPGFTPRFAGYHALVNATVVPAPGIEIPRATLVISNGLIASLQSDGPVPAGARAWDYAGLTVYAGFVEPYVAQSLAVAAAPLASGDPATDQRPLADEDLGPRFFGVPGQERDAGSPGPGAFTRRVTPELRVATLYTPTPKTLESLQELGFTAAHIVPSDGLIRGQSAVVSLGAASPNRAVLRADLAQCVGFDPGPTDGTVPAPYPGSLMGAVAVFRQTFLDAAHHAATKAYASGHPEAGLSPPFNAAWDALRAVTAGQTVLFDAGSVLMMHRAAQLARELGLNHTAFLATGQEWRRPDLLAAIGGPFILPLAHPALPKIAQAADWEDVSLDQLRAWDWAPETAALLERAALPFALSTHGLTERQEFRKNLAASLERGLSRSNALRALTLTPAQLTGLADRLGTVEPGKLAHLTVVAGDYFNPTSRVHAVWVEGVPHELPRPRRESPVPSQTATNATTQTTSTNLPPFPRPALARVARAPLDLRGPLQRPAAVLVRHATIWTCGPAGVLTNASLLIRQGRIEAVGTEPADAADGALIVEGNGLHLTPGLIDCHSHSAILGSVNEGTIPSSAMVRIEDVINSESPEMLRQLAGGLTVANLLHGSANPIGGQNAVIKLREGAPPDGLRLPGAPAGIKFALGENVKQANWGDRQTTRFPQTRMGVPTFFANRFTAAQRYRQALQARQTDPSLPPLRRDLELEALAEILEGRRLIHCHSYRQDEIVVFLRTMESFGVRVATLQHVLEGYKVADEIARHGAGASTFSDWWAFKMEVIDAIPYAGSLMRERGVTVSFNSDSSDHARRLNTEAAKAVKYGGTTEAEALRFVTLNPARQLGIDARVGSLERGKDGDFAVWSGHPLDTRSLCLQTWIEGHQYFERAAQETRTQALREEHTALLAKARNARTGGTAEPSAAARARFFQRAWESASHLGVVDCQDCVLQRRP
ncbi:MAG: amidohydrolase family protein [Verrucomicrobiales bacterium]|nr:amidohydrolase family protein [Verrucomicrobiales bacterium]